MRVYINQSDIVKLVQTLSDEASVRGEGEDALLRRNPDVTLQEARRARDKAKSGRSRRPLQPQEVGESRTRLAELIEPGPTCLRAPRPFPISAQLDN